jgi:hypothetical protein
VPNKTTEAALPGWHVCGWGNRFDADKARDALHCRAYPRKQGIKGRIARRSTIPYDRRAGTLEALLRPGYTLICWNFIHLKGLC